MAPSNKLASREKHLAAAGLAGDVPGLPLLAIRGYLCFRCLEHQETRRRCKKCQRATYCSKECQAEDWIIVHRLVCKSLQKVNEVESNGDAQSKSWDEFAKNSLSKALLATQTANSLDRNQSNELGQIIAGQPYCTTCYATAFQTANHSATLSTCTTCKLASSCSRCVQRHSEDQCSHYKFIADLELYRLQLFEVSGQVSVIEPVAEPIRMEQYKRLSSYSSWADFFIHVPVRGQRLQEMYNERLHFALATDSSTIPLTILAALEASMPRYVEQETLQLHLIGAASREAKHLILFEDVLHLLPRLQRLRLVLCGPNTQFPDGQSSGDVGQELEMGCCEACLSNDRKRTVSFYNGFYHDYADLPTYRKPDLAVIFHSGRSQEAVESWAPTTRFLVSSGTRTVCTTYTAREAEEETAELDSLRARFVLRPEENRWRSLAPLPELFESREDAVYFFNYYWYIFEGLKTS